MPAPSERPNILSLGRACIFSCSAISRFFLPTTPQRHSPLSCCKRVNLEPWTRSPANRIRHVKTPRPVQLCQRRVHHLNLAIRLDPVNVHYSLRTILLSHHVRGPTAARLGSSPSLPTATSSPRTPPISLCPLRLRRLMSMHPPHNNSTTSRCCTTFYRCVDLT